MRATILAIRSIGAEFIRRLYRPIAIVTVILLAILLGLSFWLTTLSSWWWILFGFVIAIGVLIVGVLAIAAGIIYFVSPMQSKPQKQQAKAIVDSLQGVSDIIRTPKFILLFRIVLDVLRPRKNGFIATVSSTASFHREFVAFVKTFK